jgi:hypothetical protein
MTPARPTTLPFHRVPQLVEESMPSSLDDIPQPPWRRCDRPALHRRGVPKWLSTAHPFRTHRVAYLHTEAQRLLLGQRPHLQPRRQGLRRRILRAARPPRTNSAQCAQVSRATSQIASKGMLLGSSRPMCRTGTSQGGRCKAEPRSGKGHRSRRMLCPCSQREPEQFPRSRCGTVRIALLAARLLPAPRCPSKPACTHPNKYRRTAPRLGAGRPLQFRCTGRTSRRMPCRDTLAGDRPILDTHPARTHSAAALARVRQQQRRSRGRMRR